MKLGYLVPEFPQQTHAFFWREAMALEDLGHEVHFMSTRHPGPTLARHPFTAEAVKRTTYLWPPAPLPMLGRLARNPVATGRAKLYALGLSQSTLAERFRALLLLAPAAELARVARSRGLDHLHVHSFANAAHVAAMARHLGGPPYSLTLHGDLPVYGKDHLAKMRQAALVTAVTRPLAAEIRAIAPRIVPQVITMGVDIDRFAPPPRADAVSPLRVLSVARLNYVKGHAVFLQAMARAVADGHDLTYDIAGDGPYRAEIAQTVADLNLTDRVTFHGSIGEDAVLSLLTRADIFALTSFGQGEAAPVAVMEAMAAGLPVICSRIGGTGDMIEDGRTGLLVPQQDAAAVQAALLRLSDVTERRRLGTAAREAAIARFDYRAQAASLAMAIEETLSP